MPDDPPSTDERASLAQPSQSSSPLEFTSHLGFSLAMNVMCGRYSLKSAICELQEWFALLEIAFSHRPGYNTALTQRGKIQLVPMQP